MIRASLLASLAVCASSFDLAAAETPPPVAESPLPLSSVRSSVEELADEMYESVRDLQKCKLVGAVEKRHDIVSSKSENIAFWWKHAFETPPPPPEKWEVLGDRSAGANWRLLKELREPVLARMPASFSLPDQEVPSFLLGVWDLRLKANQVALRANSLKISRQDEKSILVDVIFDATGKLTNKYNHWVWFKSTVRTTTGNYHVVLGAKLVYKLSAQTSKPFSLRADLQTIPKPEVTILGKDLVGSNANVTGFFYDNVSMFVPEAQKLVINKFGKFVVPVDNPIPVKTASVHVDRVKREYLRLVFSAK